MDEFGLRTGDGVVSIELQTDAEDAVSSFVAGCSQYAFHVKKAAPRSHESAGQAERTVRAVKESFKTMLLDFQGMGYTLNFFEGNCWSFVDLYLHGPVKSFEVWGRTIIKMDKYAKKWSFAELVAFSHVDKKAMTYTRWLIGKFATPPLTDPGNQAEDYGTFARACGIQLAKAGCGDSF